VDLDRNCDTLEIQLYEKYKLSKEVLIGSCTVKLRDVISQCLQMCVSTPRTRPPGSGPSGP
jgi:hypothetical protein